MSMLGCFSRFPDGYYNDNGEWQRTKFCFAYCGHACTCGPPASQWYSAAHDKRLGGAAGSGVGSTEGSGPPLGVGSPDEVHVPVEATDAPADGAQQPVSGGGEHGD